MGFSRAVAPVSPPETDALTEDMAGIGMNLGGRANHRANIENTLFFASKEGMDRADLRVLSVLVTWLGIHGARVNVDRLAKLVGAGGPSESELSGRRSGVGSRRIVATSASFVSPRASPSICSMWGPASRFDVTGKIPGSKEAPCAYRQTSCGIGRPTS